MAGEKEDWSQGGEVWGGVQTPGDEGGWVGCPRPPRGPAAGLGSGTPRWPSLTVMREGTHGLTTNAAES